MISIFGGSHFNITINFTFGEAGTGNRNRQKLRISTSFVKHVIINIQYSRVFSFVLNILFLLKLSMLLIFEFVTF